MVFLSGRALYNSGRVVTYAAMGAIFGFLGQSLLLAGWQRGLSIAAGVLILAYVVLRWLGPARWNIESAALRVLAPVQRLLGRLLREPRAGSLFVIGLLNGLLPCGLVYVALAGAAATGNGLAGAQFMAIFGVGTVPLMLAVSLIGPSLHGALRGRFQRVVPLALTVLAAMFILRGLELGIPYISPNLTAQVEQGAAPACCRH
jgi:sulfite exporter TauE/SafE